MGAGLRTTSEVVREPGRFAAFKANVQWRWSKQRHSGRPMALNVFGDRSFDELTPQSCLKCAADPCPPDQEMEVLDWSKVDWKPHCSH